MKRIASYFFAASVLLAGALQLLGQSVQVSMGQNAQFATKPNGSQTRQPYTAEFKVTQVQTLANGTIITHESTEMDARDSQGRHFHSTTNQTPSMGRPAVTSGNMNDPVEGTQSNWDSVTKKVRLIRLPPQDQRQGCWTNDSGNSRMSWNEGPKPGKPAPNGMTIPGGGTIVPAPRNKPEIEDLGKTTIQGVEAHGHRFTTTIPAGEIGNDQPIVTVSETWMSPQLGIVLREVSDDPRSGKRTRELVNITLAEPEPATFQPPEGYEVTTEELHQVTCPAQR